MAELADAADSKSADLRVLGVRLPLPAPKPDPFEDSSLTRRNCGSPSPSQRRRGIIFGRFLRQSGPVGILICCQLLFGRIALIPSGGCVSAILLRISEVDVLRGTVPRDVRA